MSYSWVMKHISDKYKREYPKSTYCVDIQKDVNNSGEEQPHEEPNNKKRGN